jgi:hypothetical protein
MLRLIKHLEDLLRNHDCVIAPQLGGFVLQSVPASYVKEDHLFQPMHKEVVFNAKLTHTDGLLHESYMQAFNVSYQRASRMLEEDVAVIMEELHKGLKVSLGAVGSFTLGAEGQLIFRSGNPETFSVDSYGLASFHLKTWESMQEENTQSNTGNQRKNVFYIPVNRRVLRVVTASAIAIVVFLLMSTPVREINRDSYKAGITASLPSSTQPDDSFFPDENDMTPDEFGAITSEDEPDSMQEAAPAPPKAVKPAATLPAKKTAEKEAPRKEAPKAQAKEEATYYIIVASVSSRKQADEFISNNIPSAATTKAGTLITGSQIRVYADKFTDKAQAEACLANLRSSAKYPGAWMFTQKK